MNNGIKTILCLITIILIMMAEKGVPVKLEKFDFIIYGFGLIALLMSVGYFN